ncbi:MAG: type I-E CRISPR-associated protein Cas5/CasD [Clostridiales bacterium]|nr:type I-E CRISPR-associated protein Cas5/CasD [Clostridiales bacterium]
MSTLLLRFAAPLQAWGSSSRFSVRTTEHEPTKSGVIGLIAAAMGRKRDEAIDDLLDVRFGVRIDQAGRVMRDFHTARSLSGEAFVSDRYYLADALFVVGLEADDVLLDKIDTAVRSPVFPIYLGRRSCPPSGPISLGVKRGLCLEDALKDTEVAPWQAGIWYQKRQAREVHLETVIDADPSEKGAFLRADAPISFDQSYRRYGYRSVVSRIDAVLVTNPLGRDVHDPMEVF